MTDAEGPAGARLWPRLRRALTARPDRSQVTVAALCGLLAFALVTQVHSTSRAAGLNSARPDDLVGILADLDGRAARLRAQVAQLQHEDSLLNSGSGQSQAALQEARQRAQTLAILTGTIAARGPGIVLTVADPRGKVHADVLVDAIEELRDAGAEAMQLSGVRIVASSAVLDGQGGGIVVDGVALNPPYRLAVIGDPRTLAAALGIPGGVVDTVAAQSGASATIVQSPAVTVTALRQLSAPRYARPTAPSGSG
jgi:uncharacterized protein YlxW (UPF0749 family)